MQNCKIAAKLQKIIESSTIILSKNADCLIKGQKHEVYPCNFSQKFLPLHVLLLEAHFQGLDEEQRIYYLLL